MKCLISEAGKRVKELKDEFVRMKTRWANFLRKFVNETQNGEFGSIPMLQTQNRREDNTSEKIKADIISLLDAAEFFFLICLC